MTVEAHARACDTRGVNDEQRPRGSAAALEPAAPALESVALADPPAARPQPGTLGHVNEEAAPASSPAPSGELSAFATQIQGAYSWDVPAVTIGTLIDGGARVPGVSAAMPVPMFNRHLLVAGATGTGKSATAAWLIERVQRPTLVIEPNKTIPIVAAMNIITDRRAA